MSEFWFSTSASSVVHSRSYVSLSVPYVGFHLVLLSPDVFSASEHFVVV